MNFFVGMLCLWRLMVSSSENWSPLTILKSPTPQVTDEKASTRPQQRLQAWPWLTTAYLAQVTANTLRCCHRRVPSRECQLLISRLSPEPRRGPAKSWTWCNCGSQSGPQNHLSVNVNEKMVIKGKNGVFFPNYSDPSSWESWNWLGNTAGCRKVSVLDSYD